MKFQSLVFATSMIIFLTSVFVYGQQEKSDSSMASIHLTVTGFKHEKGTVKIALVNSKESYESNEDIFIGKNEVITDKQVTCTFGHIPEGYYALKVFHDENDNEKLDTNFFGVPKEPYGFSNNVRGKLGPPDFKEVKFAVSDKDVTLKIEVK